MQVLQQRHGLFRHIKFVPFRSFGSHFPFYSAGVSTPVYVHAIAFPYYSVDLHVPILQRWCDKTRRISCACPSLALHANELFKA